jgi:hypothetical protein
MIYTTDNSFGFADENKNMTEQETILANNRITSFTEIYERLEEKIPQNVRC